MRTEIEQGSADTKLLKPMQEYIPWVTELNLETQADSIIQMPR